MHAELQLCRGAVPHGNGVAKVAWVVVATVRGASVDSSYAALYDSSPEQSGQMPGIVHCIGRP